MPCIEPIVVWLSFSSGRMMRELAAVVPVKLMGSRGEN